MILGKWHGERLVTWAWKWWGCWCNVCVLNPLLHPLHAAVRQDTLLTPWLFSPPCFGPVLPILPLLGEARLGKMIKRLHYFDLLRRKRILKIVETVILSLCFITMVCDSTGDLCGQNAQIYRLLQTCYFWYQTVGDVSVWNIVCLHSLAQNSLKCQYYVFMFLVEFNDVTSIAPSPFEVLWPFPDFGKIYYDND